MNHDITKALQSLGLDTRPRNVLETLDALLDRLIAKVEAGEFTWDEGDVDQRTILANTLRVTYRWIDGNLHLTVGDRRFSSHRVPTRLADKILTLVFLIQAEDTDPHELALKDALFAAIRAAS